MHYILHIYIYTCPHIDKVIHCIVELIFIVIIVVIIILIHHAGLVPALCVLVVLVLAVHLVHIHPGVVV